MQLTGSQRCAVFLLAMGEDVATDMLGRMQLPATAGSCPDNGSHSQPAARPRKRSADHLAGGPDIS